MTNVIATVILILLAIVGILVIRERISHCNDNGGVMIHNQCVMGDFKVMK